uniref:Structural maintenance of chromosomes protein 5 n=1 Tax=Globodera rostochiensis TaxID=31243 RepID=A0A914HEP9_GLORO
MHRSIENKENDVPMAASSSSNTTRIIRSGRRAAAASSQTQQSPFAHGAIIRIQFTNFLTYDRVSVRPGPHLNVVIGPNGTGKSSIICGICLAVGGSPKVLGRSDMIGDFVKHGKLEGTVDLFLWDSRRKRERCFTVHIKVPNSASYFVDNQQVKLTELRERVREYNIQVENPCTFLAQDKVKSFAEQGPQILLKNTEKAGPTELGQLHETLLEQSDDGKELQANFDRCSKRLEQLVMELKTKKARVENYNEWSNRSKVLKLLKLKKALLDYEKELDVQRRLLVELDEIDAARQRAEKENKTRKKTIERVGNTIEELTQELADNWKEHKKNVNETDRLKCDMNKLKDEDLRDAALQLEQMRRRHADFDKQKTLIKNEYQKFRAAYERAKIDYKPNPVLAQTKEQLVREQYRLGHMKKEIIERQDAQRIAKNQLNAQMDEQRDLLETKLQNIVRLTGNPGILHAWHFYWKNRDQFQGPVYVPYLHMRVPDPANLMFLNNLIGTRDLGIFVFTCKEDEDLLLRGNNPHRIHATIIDQHRIEQAVHVRSLHHNLPATFASMGFTAFASTLIEAPESVFAYLCFTFSLDRVLIGGAAVEENYEQIAHQLPDKSFSLFLTPNYRIDVTFSRFNAQQRYTRRSALGRAFRLNQDHTKRHQFNTNFDAMENDCRREQEELNELIKRYTTDKETWTQRIEMYQTSLRADQDKRKQIEDLQRQMERMQADLDQQSQGKPNLAEAEAAYTQQKRAIAENITNKFEQYIDTLNRRRSISVKIVLADDEVKRLKQRMRAVNQDDNGIDEQLDLAKKRYQELTKKRETAKLDVEDAKSHFRELSTFSPAEAEQSPEQMAKFTKTKEDFLHYRIPNDADAWTERWNKELDKASKGRQEGTEKDVHDYQRMVDEHEQLGNEVRRVDERNKRWKRSMDDKLKAWLDPLGVLVTDISNNFTNFFAQLGCAGEVRLDVPTENKYNVAEYGLSILVKFRNGIGLRVLDPHTQSGGERSVATMLYLLALQNLCPVPFRCMDEINQGMDPDNERAVFNMMVRLLSTGGGENIAKTQYFLLTPKLLNGLEFNERVTVHIVHNGPDIEHGEHWDPERFLNSQSEDGGGGQQPRRSRRIEALAEGEEEDD